MVLFVLTRKDLEEIVSKTHFSDEEKKFILSKTGIDYIEKSIQGALNVLFEDLRGMLRERKCAKG